MGPAPLASMPAAPPAATISPARHWDDDASVAVWVCGRQWRAADLRAGDGRSGIALVRHEVVVLRLKSKSVLDRIQQVSALWPKKKEFIEGAYKLLLFSKGQRRYALSAIKVFRKTETLPVDFFDFK